MHRGLAVLRPSDVQRRIAAPFNLRPFEIGDLDGPQAVPEGNQDQRCVPVAVAPQLGGAAVSALTAKAKLAGMWREKVDQHNTGSPVYERIERVIVERAPQSAPIPDESIYDEPTEVGREMTGRHWSAD